MSAWVYLVSQFSHEALLFEALIILALIIVYSGFWLLSKRKYGSVKSAVPSGVVKAHLNELIQDAEKLRAQLFGILYQGGGETPLSTGEPRVHVQHTTSSEPSAGGSSHSDPQLDLRVGELEAKIKEQLSVISKVETDKATLAAEIEKLKLAKPAAAAGGGGAEVDGLKSKLKELEDRLEEYSIIEDDLANLKRLQQENAALKKQLAGAPAASASPVVAPAIAAAVVPTEPVSAAPAPAEPVPVAAAPPVTEAPAAAAPAEPAPAATDSQLSALANDVEKSIEAAMSAGTGATAAETPVPAASTSPAPTTPAAAAKSQEDDLLKEFEKMLNS